MNGNMSAKLLEILERATDDGGEFCEWVESASNTDKVNRNCFLCACDELALCRDIRHRHRFHFFRSINLCDRFPNMDRHAPHFDATTWIKRYRQIADPCCFRKFTHKAEKGGRCQMSDSD